MLRWCFVVVIIVDVLVDLSLRALPPCSKNYGIEVKEMDQPLLVHRPKERSRPGGKVRDTPSFVTPSHTITNRSRVEFCPFLVLTSRKSRLEFEADT